MPVEKALTILQDEARMARLDQNLVDLFIQEKIWADEVVISGHEAD